MDPTHQNAKKNLTPTLAPSVPLDTLWTPSALVAIFVVGEGVALVLTLAANPEHTLLEYLGVASLVIQWASLLSLSTLYLFRGYLATVPPTRVAWTALWAIVLHTVGVVSWGRIALGSYWLEGKESWAALALRMAGIALIVGLLGLAAFQSYWAARKAVLRTKQAELESLQARIKPHFLFNTLNTAAALVHERPEQAEQLLLDLSDLFRAALAGPREVLLEEEVSLTRRYLEIEQLRLGDRLRVDWLLPEIMPRFQVPSLSLQPLVENAVRYGIEPVQRGGRIEISVATSHSFLTIRVRSPLVLSERSRSDGHGVGLRATRARIEALTNGRGSVQREMQGEHYVSTVTLPLRLPPIGGKRRR